MRLSGRVGERLACHRCVWRWLLTVGAFGCALVTLRSVVSPAQVAKLRTDLALSAPWAAAAASQWTVPEGAIPVPSPLPPAKLPLPPPPAGLGQRNTGRVQLSIPPPPGKSSPPPPPKGQPPTPTSTLPPPSRRLVPPPPPKAHPPPPKAHPPKAHPPAPKAHPPPKAHPQPPTAQLSQPQGRQSACAAGDAGVELEGLVVRDGYKLLTENATACCNVCSTHTAAPSGQSCNTWVWCGDKAACGWQHRQCWLKHSTARKPRLTGNQTGWTSGGAW